MASSIPGRGPVSPPSPSAGPTSVPEEPELQGTCPLRDGTAVHVYAQASITRAWKTDVLVVREDVLLLSHSRFGTVIGGQRSEVRADVALSDPGAALDSLFGTIIPGSGHPAESEDLVRRAARRARVLTLVAFMVRAGCSDAEISEASRMAAAIDVVRG